MHLYWRIKEELQYLGEVPIFHDPSLFRAYRQWIRKNALALAYTKERRDISESHRTCSPCRHF